MNWFRRKKTEYTMVTFSVVAQIDHGENVAVVGDARALGAFSPTEAVHLVTTPADYPVWTTQKPLLLPRGLRVKYKYVIFSGGRFRGWESLGGDREVVPHGPRLTLRDTLHRATDSGRRLGARALSVSRGAAVTGAPQRRTHSETAGSSGTDSAAREGAQRVPEGAWGDGRVVAEGDEENEGEDDGGEEEEREAAAAAAKADAAFLEAAAAAEAVEAAETAAAEAERAAAAAEGTLAGVDPQTRADFIPGAGADAGAPGAVGGEEGAAVGQGTALGRSGGPWRNKLRDAKDGAQAADSKWADIDAHFACPVTAAFTEVELLPAAAPSDGTPGDGPMASRDGAGDDDADAGADLAAAAAAARDATRSSDAVLRSMGGRLLLVSYLLPVRVTLRLGGEWDVEWAEEHLAARSSADTVAELMPTAWVGTVALVTEEVSEPPEPAGDDPFRELYKDNPYFVPRSHFDATARAGAGADAEGGLVEGEDGDAAPAPAVFHRVRPLREEERAAVAQALARLNCTAVFLSPELHRSAHRGYCRSVLWPVLHNVLEVGGDGVDRSRPRDSVDDEEWFAAYTAMNRVFATVVMRLWRPADTVWVHDYHLLLLPLFLRRAIAAHRTAAGRARRAAAPDATALVHRIVFFLHTPFPTSEIFRTLPRRAAILEGVLSADIVGFHVFNYARHFLNACKRYLGLVYQSRPGGNMGVDFAGRNVVVTVSHVSIEHRLVASRAAHPLVRAAAARLRARHAGRLLIVGLDRCQRLQGVTHKLLAFEWLLMDCPVWVDRVAIVQRCGYSRSRPRDTRTSSVENRRLVRRLLDNIPGAAVDYREFDGDVPLVERLALFLAGDVLLQSPVCEGLNRVPFEYAFVRAAPLSPGVVVLSEFAAANHALNGCLRVNPFHVSEVASALDTALSMSEEEKAARRSRDLRSVDGHSSGTWTRQIIADMHRTLEPGGGGPGGQLLVLETDDEEGGSRPRTHLLGTSTEFARADVGEVATAFRAAPSRCVVVNYGGTLVRREAVGVYMKQLFTGTPHRALHRDKRALLHRLASSARSEVVVVSGMEREAMAGRIGDARAVTLVAESGQWVSWGREVRARVR